MRLAEMFSASKVLQFHGFPVTGRLWDQEEHSYYVETGSLAVRPDGRTQIYSWEKLVEFMKEKGVDIDEQAPAFDGPWARVLPGPTGPGAVRDRIRGRKSR
jgi:hypothetical protein